MRKRPTVRLFKSFQLLLGAFLFLTAGVHAASEERMTLATIRSVTQAPFWVALESGFYKDYGLEVLPVPDPPRQVADPQFLQGYVADGEPLP